MAIAPSLRSAARTRLRCWGRSSAFSSSSLTLQLCALSSRPKYVRPLPTGSSMSRLITLSLGLALLAARTQVQATPASTTAAPLSSPPEWSQQWESDYSPLATSPPPPANADEDDSEVTPASPAKTGSETPSMAPSPTPTTSETAPTSTGGETAEADANPTTESEPNQSTCPNGSTLVSVEGVGSFCVSTSEPICSADISTGKCPAQQHGLNRGSYCGKVKSGVYGCLPRAAAPKECDVHDD